MIILGIETSCDETSLSIILQEENRVTVLGNAVLSQINVHKQYGGVFPALAKREHSKNLVPILKGVLKEADMLETSKSNSVPHEILGLLDREPELKKDFELTLGSIQKPAIDAIAVTKGPGLEPALWVGINFAKALSKLWDIPLFPVNHMEGHTLVALLREVESRKSKVKSYEIVKPNFPAVALLISGGHTEFVLVKDWLSYEIVGSTKDDAVGEAYDKVARILGLPYPGGPEIEKLSKEARSNNEKSRIKLPRPMLKSNDLHFSFSGLKTAVLYAVKKIHTIDERIQREIAREFEDSIIEVLTTKAHAAIEQFSARTLLLGGGVIANAHIRDTFIQLAQKYNFDLHIPERAHSTDNAFMIALAAALHIQNQKTPAQDFRAEGNLRLS